MPASRIGVALLPVLSFLWVAFPSLQMLALGLWQSDDHAFEPLILIMSAVMAGLIWRQDAAPVASARSGYALIVLAAASLCIGVLLNNIFVRSTSLLVMLAGAILAIGGWNAIRRYRWPLLALVFALPLPGAWVTAMTFPLKLLISRAATAILWHCGLPISNQGVSIDLGNYRLLVADACSGLQSMFSLMAVAILYLFLMQVSRARRAIPLLAAIVPIVIVLNVLRVLVLALITYGFGSDAAESFLHLAAGILMFAAAFGCLMLVDTLLVKAGRA